MDSKIMQKKIIEDHLEDKTSIILVGPIGADVESIKNIHQELKSPIICIDGGANNFPLPHLCIGDGDSLKRECKISFSTEKDFTDLEGFIEYIPSNIKKIYAFGFTGGRLDHQMVVIGNFFKLATDKEIQIQVNGSEILTILPQGDHDLEVRGIFSILTLHEAQISVSGDCKYTLKSKTFPPLSGNLLSNIGRGKIKLSSNFTVGVINVKEN